MSEKRESIHGQWSSRWVFILAATGSAVGLGNVWKFPYITGENGGGAFVLVYLACILVIGIPIMMAEIMLGRLGRRSPINTMRHLAEDEGRSPWWQILGWSGAISGFLILAYYSVIAGWALGYVFRTAGGLFEGQTADGVGAIFGDFLGNPEVLLLWHTVFMVMTTVIIARGVKNGLEQAVRFLMPALFVILLILVGYAMNTGHFAEGLSYLFTPDFSKLSKEGFLTALGHAFFTLSLGMGAIMVYGSYLPKNTSIGSTTLMIAGADTLVALLAGMAIFPIVFANALEPGAGPGLVFVTLPIAFGQMDGGVVIGTLFFVLLVFAAWSSAISLIEPFVAWLVENKGMSRVKAATIAGITTWFLGVSVALTLNNNVFSFTFSFLGETKSDGMFDILDILTANIMLPVGGLFIAVFVAWKMRRELVLEALDMNEGPLFEIWHVVLRFIAPLAVIVVVLQAFGVWKALGLPV